MTEARKIELERQMVDARLQLVMWQEVQRDAQKGIARALERIRAADDELRP